jgi:hypothetical protein
MHLLLNSIGLDETDILELNVAQNIEKLTKYFDLFVEKNKIIEMY